MALYDRIGHSYAGPRRPDPRIAAAIEAALGDAESVLNVGAGSGSYEAEERSVIAVEPSAVMIAQRPPGAAPCIRAVAEALPIASRAVDAAMAILSVHHWTDAERGLAEMARVARRRIVLLTWVPDAPRFWLTTEYFPEIADHDRLAFTDSAALGARLCRIAGPARLTTVPIPHDCVDGFLCAYWRRPEAYLDHKVRSGMSSFSKFDPSPGLRRLEADLASGRWHERHGHLLEEMSLDAGYRVVSCELST